MIWLKINITIKTMFLPNKYRNGCKFHSLFLNKIKLKNCSHVNRTYPVFNKKK